MTPTTATLLTETAIFTMCGTNLAFAFLINRMMKRNRALERFYAEASKKLLQPEGERGTEYSPGSWTWRRPAASIRHHRCGMASSNPHDIHERYCAFCHQFLKPGEYLIDAREDA